jgi:hypothetical protein
MAKVGADCLLVCGGEAAITLNVIKIEGTEVTMTKHWEAESAVGKGLIIFNFTQCSVVFLSLEISSSCSSEEKPAR